MSDKIIDYSKSNLKCNLRDFDSWLIEKSQKDKNFTISHSAYFLLKTLCLVSHQDLMLMLTFLNLDRLYERFAEHKVLPDTRKIEENTANDIKNLAAEYLKEFALSKFEYHYKRKLEQDSLVLFDFRLKKLRKLYPLDIPATVTRS